MLIAQTAICRCWLKVLGLEKRDDNPTKKLAYGEAIFSPDIGDMEVFLEPDDGKNIEVAYVFNETAR